MTAEPNNDTTQGKTASAAGVLDPDALRRKYQEERSKRLRADGKAQFQATVGEFEHYLEDPYAGEPQPREAITEEVDVLVIGAGFGGMLLGARLHEAGITSFKVIEKAADVGGTWYWNRYPGIACDIESYIYLPLLEEVGYVPTQKYASGAEIFSYCQRFARHYDLYEHAVFQTEVTDARWNEEQERWEVTTNRDDVFSARFVCVSAGPIHRPKLPGIPGIETFKGHSFHTSRWDYAYTGGSMDSPLTGLADKRVGVIGTGATAVQCVPRLANDAGHLYVFQRTPSSIDIRGNRPTDPSWAETLGPGWQKDRMRNFSEVLAGLPVDEDLVHDSWTDSFTSIGRGAADGDEAARKQLADYRKMDQIRARVDAIVADPATAEALKPYYNLLCKRPCFHDDYLAVFNRPNVTLVDTDGQGVERVTEHAVVAGGVTYELDCLVFATGFEFFTNFALRAGFEIYGRDGVSLTEKWAGGVMTRWGMHMRGFPNCFIIGNTQDGRNANFTHTLDVCSAHVAYVVDRCLREGVGTIEPTEEAEAAWAADMLSYGEVRRKFDAQCTPGYLNNEGESNDRTVLDGFYGGGLLTYQRILAAWRDAGDLEGFDTHPALQPAIEDESR